MSSIIQINVQNESMIVFGDFHPWKQHKNDGGTSNDYPQHSADIWDVKKNRPIGISRFAGFMKRKARPGRVVCIVPSHDPDSRSEGMRKLAQELIDHNTYDDGLDCLVRHTIIEKLSAGGDRSVNVHLDSIRVENPEILAGRDIILMDDVVTTGGSLVACKQLLMAAGAGSVRCVALGRTPLQNTF